MNQYIYFIVIIAIVLFGVYRRVRKTVGYQTLDRRRLTTRLVIFVILALVILFSGKSLLFSYVTDAIGLVIGGVIAYISVRTTKFEVRNGCWAYAQHKWIGVSLIVILIGRFAFRIVEIYQEVSSVQQNSANSSLMTIQNFSDPWTSGVFMLLVAYYVVYFSFLLLKERQLGQPPSIADGEQEN